MTRILLLSTAIVVGLAVTVPAVAFPGRMGPEDRPSFGELDTNGDGKISAAELDAFPAALASERFASADTNGDGKISKEELAASVDTTRSNRAAARIDNMVARFDTDKDGAVSEAEMTAAMGEGRRAPAAPGERFVQMADTDKDGVISEAEYEAAANLMNQRAGRFDDRRDFGKRGSGGRGGARDGLPFWRN